MSLGNHSNQSFQDPVRGYRVFLKEFQWRQMFLTKEVHINLGLTIATNVLTWPFTVLINAMVIYIVFSSPLLRSVPSNISVALMSITDFATAAVARSLFIASASCRISGRCNSCIVDLTRNISLMLFCTSSAFHLALMALDRLISIKFPLRYIDLVTTRRIITVVALAWTLAILQAPIPFAGTDSSIMADVGRVIIVLCVVAAIFIIICYLIIYLESRRHQISIQAKMQQNPQQATKIEFKAAKITFLITCAVGVIYLVNGVVIAVVGAMLYRDRSDSNARLFFNVECWSLTLVLLNSLFNPLIYSMRSEKIASAIRKLLHLETVCHLQLQRADANALPAGNDLQAIHGNVKLQGSP